ncbi:MAG: SDR family NAD(P)-dependent oxidoreductase, partial [Clostridiales bacterium]|nr:SDR family NAD(P)-dependent oxidoreductase [Clostridiales bacterium]
MLIRSLLGELPLLRHRRYVLMRAFTKGTEGVNIPMIIIPHPTFLGRTTGILMNKVVLVTGASSGIGFACAEYFASKGLKVYGTTRRLSEGKAYPKGVTMLELDICIDESVERAVNAVMKAEGRIDILVNNAGCGIAGAIEDTSVSEAQGQMDTNFMGIHRMCKWVLPYMRSASMGSIVNISSVAGFVPIPFQAFYTASKYAVEAYTRALRLEVKPFGIRVSAVEPGDTCTGLLQA